MSGPWEGRWVSESNGHNGKLRCVIKPAEGNIYNAHFRAHYQKIFRFSYSVPLKVQQDGTNFTFSGEANLGKLAGGVYTYEGHSTPTEFFSNYGSKHDQGKFELSRPKEK